MLASRLMTKTRWILERCFNDVLLGMQCVGVWGTLLERLLNSSFINRSDSPGDNQPVDTRLRTVITVMGVLVALTLASGRAFADNDQDRARAAVLTGRALPLSTVLERLAKTHPGQVLEVEFEEEGGRYIYEIKLLQPGRRLLKLEIDAATSEVLKRKERVLRSDDRP